MSPIFVVLCWAVSARADDRELVRISEEMAKLGQSLRVLTEEGLSPDVVRGTRSFSERMADAEILFKLGDYARSSLVLMDLVNEPRYAKEPLYGRAVYYLAESLYQIGNDLSARDYFAKVVERHDAFLGDAVRRMIQIGDRNQGWKGLEAEVAALQKSGPMPPDIAYIQAKSLLRQNKAREALALARQIPKEHKLYAKARYLAAVAAVELQDFAKAAVEFEALTKLEGELEDGRQVAELAAMNQGRLLLELGSFSQSADAYQFIPRESPLFEEALYETIWTHVKAAEVAKDAPQKTEEYKKALGGLEILLLDDVETRLQPEARLLKGNILIKLGRYSEATMAFGDIAARYAPVRDDLSKLVAQVTDPVQYFEEVSTRSRQGDGLLPPLALKWATGGENLSHAMEVVADLATSEEWVRDARNVAERLMVALDSEQRGQFFPALRKVQVQRLELYNSLTALSQRLLVAEREAVGGSLSAKLREELDAVLAERKRLEPEYRKLPHKKLDLEARLATMKLRVQDLESQAFQLRFPLENMERELTAMAQWLAEHPNALPAPELKAQKQRMAQQRREMEAMKSLLRDLDADIDKEKARMQAARVEKSKDEELLARYNETLDRERDILSSAGGGAPQNVQKTLQAIDKQRLVFAAYYAELASFTQRLDQVLAERAKEARAEVLQQLALLDAQQKAVTMAWVELKRVVGEVAAIELLEVRDNFADIVLRADVGVVDVAWQMKEELTHEISRKVNDQKREVQVLDEEFQQVLRD